jgi:hypothetical protein
MHENPSAGKFEPPPQPKPPGDDRSRQRWLLLVLIVATSYPVTHWLLRPRGRGWPAWVTGGIVLVLTILHYAFQRAHAEEIGGNDPYSPPTSITR